MANKIRNSGYLEVDDVNQVLFETENSLRDFIERILRKQFGEDWLVKSGINKEHVDEWRKRKAEESKRQRIGPASENLIYYAELSDLRKIINKNWDPFFRSVFDNKKEFEVYFDKLEAFRITDAHRRELLPHQKQLLIGIAGEMRTRIIRSRNQMDRLDSIFPRIELVRDSLGNKSDGGMTICSTDIELTPGDVLDYVVTAYDPEGLPLEYYAGSSIGRGIEWSKNNSLQVKIEKKDISKDFFVEIKIRSFREYHAHPGYDDRATFKYKVLPM